MKAVGKSLVGFRWDAPPEAAVGRQGNWRITDEQAAARFGGAIDDQLGISYLDPARTFLIQRQALRSDHQAAAGTCRLSFRSAGFSQLPRKPADHG